MFKIKIDILHIPSGMNLGPCYASGSNMEDYEKLKAILIDGVRGELTFIKLQDIDKNDILFGKEILIHCKIIMYICKNNE